MFVEHWVWLQQVLGYASDKLPIILRHFGDAKGFYEASDDKKIEYGALNSLQAERLHKISSNKISDVIRQCEKTDITPVTPDSVKYPRALLNIADPPAVIYCRGAMPNVDDEVTIGIVGPRRASSQGLKISFQMAYSLGLANCIIASGGARGVDAMAHNGALEAAAKTIAVMGCGLNADYLKCNEKLRERIVLNGCIISEYTPETLPFPWNFPVRNRLISGISKGVVVTEAGVRSGALITASHAAEQGKDVFVVEGNPELAQYEGSAKLIEDGAVPLSSPGRILAEYFPDVEYIPETEKIEKIYNKLFKKVKDIISADTQEIVLPPQTPEINEEILSKIAVLICREFTGKIFYTDEVIAKLNLEFSETISALIELELLGIIGAVAGGRYVFI
ncbi:MAG: DNA-processing protein DprA [Oscillospiraceae bacterium]